MSVHTWTLAGTLASPALSGPVYLDGLAGHSRYNRVHHEPRRTKDVEYGRLAGGTAADLVEDCAVGDIQPGAADPCGLCILGASGGRLRQSVLPLHRDVAYPRN
ncbi:hypothetical protein ACFTAO_02840 [Paenibacillus rhizoplanae]